MLALRPQATLEETRRTVDRVRAILAREPAVVGDTWVSGASPPRVCYNVTVATDRVPSAANAFIDTTSPEATREMLPRLRRTLAAAIPEAEVLVLPFEQGPLFDAPVEVEVYGPDLATLREVGDVVLLILGRSVNVTNTRATLTGGRPKLALDVDADVARTVGFDLSEVARRLSDGLDGVVGGGVVEDTEELSVRVRADGDVRGYPARIAVLPLAASTTDAATIPRVGSTSLPPAHPTGVPLDALGRPTLEPTYGSITRYQGERVNRIQAFIEPFAVPSETLADFERRLAAAGPILPAGYRIGFGGEQRESGKSQAGLLAMVGPLVVLMTATVRSTTTSPAESATRCDGGPSNWGPRPTRRGWRRWSQLIVRWACCISRRRLSHTGRHLHQGLRARGRSGRRARDRAAASSGWGRQPRRQSWHRSRPFCARGRRDGRAGDRTTGTGPHRVEARRRPASWCWRSPNIWAGIPSPRDERPSPPSTWSSW